LYRRQKTLEKWLSASKKIYKKGLIGSEINFFEKTSNGSNPSASTEYVVKKRKRLSQKGSLFLCIAGYFSGSDYP
jgi:hypothetical protein